MKKIALASLAACLMLAACSDSPTGVGQMPSLSEATGATQVRVMSQNVYVGADVDAVLIALVTPDTSDDMPQLLNAIQTFQKTDFAVRAGAFADVIAQKRPHVVGLNEITDVHINLGGLAFDVEFMPIIQEQLAARGLHYTVAAIHRNIDARPLEGIEMVDYDAILVNTDLASVDSSYGQTFTYNLGAIAPGVELKRGFVEVAATIEGKRYWFVASHPEPDFFGMDLTELRAGQILELVSVLGTASPAFVMGDLNDRPGRPEYQVLQGAGFQDLWATFNPDDLGYTAGGEVSADNPADLSNPERHFVQRIDYIWARGAANPEDGLQGWIKRLGVLPNERVQGPAGLIWPSDHAGLLTQVNIP